MTLIASLCTLLTDYVDKEGGRGYGGVYVDVTTL